MTAAIVGVLFAVALTGWALLVALVAVLRLVEAAERILRHR